MRPLRLLFVALGCFSMGTPQMLGWDFSPKEVSAKVDGPVPRHYALSSGNRKINLRVDRLTKVSGSSDAVEFSFPSIKGSSFKLSQSPLNEKKPDFLLNLPLYTEAVLKFIPAGATDIVLVVQNKNPYPINDWTSHQFVYKYSFYGRAFQSSYTFLNYNPQEQWLVEITSSPADFEATTAQASRILNSFNETDLSYEGESVPN